MERPYRIIFPEPRWPWLHTALRILFTGLLIWAFSVGSSPLSFGIGALLGVVNALALLLAYELAIRDLSSGWISAGIYTLIGASLIGYGAWLATRPPPPTGPLLPAREATPDASCAEKVGPKTLVMAFSTDRDVACTINDNVYAPTMPLQLRPFRPDPHSIVVLDRFDQEVLYVRYLNPNAVRIRGRFLCGTAPQAVIHDDAILVGGVRISGAYFGQRPARGHVCATVKAGASGIAITGP